MIITIDGPAGTGKTTVARLLSQKLKYHYFDTGAMYRALTYRLGKEGLDLRNDQVLNLFLQRFRFDIYDSGGGKKYFVDGEDVTDSIRSADVTQRVSEVSAHPAVRHALVAIQREFGEGKNAVFEGRDMGTVVFPKADFKFFLTARPAVRAERRYLEFKQKKNAHHIRRGTPCVIGKGSFRFDKRDLSFETGRRCPPYRYLRYND